LLTKAETGECEEKAYMRQSIRALGWAITISMLIVFAFLVTAVYSVFQSVLMEQGIKTGGFQSSFLNNTFVFSVPITVNNTGYFDINDFNISAVLKDANGTTLTASSVFVPEIKKGSSETRLYNLSMNLADIISNMAYLLFNDTEFKIDFSVGFRYAKALGFQLAMRNTSMPWGAPLSGLTLRGLQISSFNATHILVNIYLEFENHSFFDIVGNLLLKVYNETGGYIGSGIASVNVPSNSRLSGPIPATINMENPLNFTGRGSIEVFFDLPAYNYTLRMGSVSYG